MIKTRLVEDPNFKCRVCTGDHVQQVRPDPLVPDGVTLETEHLLLPRGLGDTISAGGGAGEVL